MRKEYSARLFQLIKTFNKREKLYFRSFVKNAQTHGNFQYQILFEAMSQQKVYNERDILKNNDGLNPKQFSNLKAYLFDLCIQSLVSCYRKESVQSNINHGLLAIEILWNKGMFEEASRVVNKIKQLAYGTEKLELLPQILMWEMKVMHRNAQTDVMAYSEHRPGIAREIESACKKIINLYQYDEIYSKLNSTIKTEGILIRNKAMLGKLNRMVKSELLNNPRIALSVAAKDRRELTLFILFHLRGEYHRALVCVRRRLELVNINPAYAKENYNRQAVILNDYLNVTYSMHRKDDFFKGLKRIRELLVLREIKKSPQISTYIVDSSANIEARWFIRQGDFKKALMAFRKSTLLSELKDMAHRGHSLLIGYNYARIYFGLTNYHESLKWINYLLKSGQINTRPDIHRAARLLYLVVQYELTDLEYMEHGFKSVHRYIARSGKLYKFENLVLQAFQKLTLCKTGKVVRSVFVQLRHDLTQVSVDPLQHNMLEYFDFISWLDGKIESKDFAEIVKKRASAQR